MSLKNKLSRLKPHLSNHVEKSQPIVEMNTIEIPFREQWEKENVFPFFFDQSYCLIREVSFPLETQHGLYKFQDFLDAVRLWNSTDVHHPLSAAGHQPEELFFFDIETTGLGGGAGNTIFLLGYACVNGENVVLRQHILPNPGAEVPLYQSFLERINYKTLVTYNGKSFDWPQVKTRHTFVREHVPKLPLFGHFDLYHAAKRLWKHKLDRLKLAIVEKEVLGVERTDDIPGYLAPMIYFDFVERKHPEGMLGILKHNEVDILSLITLYTHLTFQLCGKDRLQSKMETYEVGRWFASIGEQEEAKKVLSKLVEGNDVTSVQAKLALAYQYKKLHDWDHALTLFLDAADKENSEICMEAAIEAAKLLEHKQRNIKQALIYCEKAIEIAKCTEIKNSMQFLVHLEKRYERLKKKIRKFPG